MIITGRDRKVIDFVTKMNCVSTKTLHELFYPSLRVAQNRLKLLTENKILKRDRDHFTSQYYYYPGVKPKQVYHNLLLTDFYKELSKWATIEVFIKEYSIEEIRSDGLVIYTKDNKSYVAFIEVELSNSPDVAKYENLYRSGKYKTYFKGVFPLIYYITDKEVAKTILKVIRISEDMKDFRLD